MSVTVQEVQASWIGGALGIHFDIYLQIDSCCYHQLSPPIPLSLLCSRRSIWFYVKRLPSSLEQ